jgi:hypothetical protein
MATDEIHSLWATICEIEPGLFRAVYSNAGTAVDLGKLPQYQTSSCVSEVRRQFEQSAATLGFGPITWIDVDMTPFPPGIAGKGLAPRIEFPSASRRAGLSG